VRVGCGANRIERQPWGIGSSAPIPVVRTNAIEPARFDAEPSFRDALADGAPSWTLSWTNCYRWLGALLSPANDKETRIAAIECGPGGLI